MSNFTGQLMEIPLRCVNVSHSFGATISRLIFFADLEPTPSGTRIKGHFGVGTRVSWFMTVWLTFVVVIGSAFIIQFVRTDADHRDWTGVVVPMGMAAWGFVITKN